MDTNRHIGFQDEAPETVVWSETSYVQSLDPLDRRTHGMSDFIIAMLYLGLFFVSFILLAASKPLGDRFDSVEPSFFIILGISGIITATLIGFLRNFILKQFMIRKIRTRADLLFEPDRNCFYLGIENPLTYNKPKLYADDFGLMKIAPPVIQIEMLRHRAQFNVTDLAASLLAVGKNLTSVQLTSLLEPYTWDGAVVAQSPPNKIIDFQSSKSNSERLRRSLIAMGVQPLS